MQDLLELVAGADEQSRTNGVMWSERPARALLMLARCTRSAFAPVRLPQPPIRRTRPRSSPTTCWHLMRKRSGSATTVRAECYGSPTKVVNYRFTVVPPCYELTTILRTTLSYAMGRSGRARRDLHGQLSHSTLYMYGGACTVRVPPCLCPSAWAHARQQGRGLPQLGRDKG